MTMSHTKMAGGRDSEGPESPNISLGGGDAGELAHGVGQVGETDSQQQPEGDAQAEVLSDQIRQALARHGAQARGHLLTMKSMMPMGMSAHMCP